MKSVNRCLSFLWREASNIFCVRMCSGTVSNALLMTIVTCTVRRLWLVDAIHNILCEICMCCARGSEAVMIEQEWDVFVDFADNVVNQFFEK